MDDSRTLSEQVTFWRSCCERGITACIVPKPFQEHLAAWLVTKVPTFRDPAAWSSSYTFDSLENMAAAVEAYLANLPPDRTFGNGDTYELQRQNGTWTVRRNN